MTSVIGFPSKEKVRTIREKYKLGTRVRLTKMDDAYAPPIGTCGTVSFVDDTGSIFVNWDNGSTLAVVHGEDKFEIVK